MPAAAHFRAFPRREMALPATIEQPPNEPLEARLVNVGLGGACIELGELLRIGAPVTLAVTTPVLWDPLIVPGRVAWVLPTNTGSVRAGVRFDHARSQTIHALLELLRTEEFD